VAETVIFYLSSDPIGYRYHKGTWMLQPMTMLQADFSIDVLIENPEALQSRPSNFLRPVDKIASIVDVLLSYPESLGAVIYWLNKDPSIIFYVIFQKRCLLCRQVALPHLKEELERTKSFLARFEEDTSAISIKQIHLSEVLSQFCLMAKTYDHRYVSWIVLQFFHFWYYSLPKAFWTLILILMGITSFRGYEILNHPPELPPALEVDPRELEIMIDKTKKIQAYVAKKQRFPQLIPLLATIQSVTKREWVATTIVWHVEGVEIHFQIDPRFQHQRKLRKHQLEHCLNKPVIWESGENDPVLILKIPSP
jgi:hypothetical protein